MLYFSLGSAVQRKLRAPNMPSIPSQIAPELTAANDNHRPNGSHEWPAYDRLKAGRLMRTPDANSKGLIALCRLRHNLVAAEGHGEVASFISDSSAINEDVESGFGSDVRVERVTGDHLVALHLAGLLEYRRAPDGQVLPFKIDGTKAYQLEDRYRGEAGPARPRHPPEVESELNGRYGGAAWPRAKGAARSARHLFHGAQIKTRPAPRAMHSPERAIISTAYARRTLSFLRGAIPPSVWEVIDMAATGSTAQAIGEMRGHSGKYASTVGMELVRMSLEALIYAYDDFDGCHQEAA